MLFPIVLLLFPVVNRCTNHKITSFLMDLVHPIRLFIVCRPRLSTWINLVHLSGSRSTGQRHHLGKKTGAAMADIQAGKYRSYMPYGHICIMIYIIISDIWLYDMAYIVNIYHICIIRNVVNSTIAITNLHMSTNGRYHDSSWPIPLKCALLFHHLQTLPTQHWLYTLTYSQGHQSSCAASSRVRCGRSGQSAAVPNLMRVMGMHSRGTKPMSSARSTTNIHP